MIEILSITFPIFAAVGLGFATVRFGVFSKSDMRVLGLYVLNVALPALLCGALAKRDLSEVLNVSYAAAFAIGGLLTIALIFTLLTVQGTGPARRAIGALGSSCPNSAYIGYPVMLLVLPDKAGVVLALNFVVENFVLVPLCLMLLDSSKGIKHKSTAHMIAAPFLSLVKRPMFIGLLLGLILMSLDVTVPTSVLRLLDMLAASASALALVVIGGTLVGLPLKGNLVLAGQILLGKLILHPAMTMLAVLLVPMLGLPALDPEMRIAVIVSAAMPMFVMSVVFAQEYGHEGLASIALLGATVGSFFTLSALLTFLV